MPDLPDAPARDPGPDNRRARWVLRLPALIRLAAVDPALRGALVLALVALAGAAVAVWFAWEHRPGSPVAEGHHPAVAPARETPTAIGPEAPGRLPSVAATTEPSGASESVLVVDVAGLVASPGVVTLSPGARVIDALERVGGVVPGTDTTGLSLARPLVDGEQILVDGSPGPAAPVAGAGPPVAGASGDGSPAAPVNLNTATVAELDELPGVGPVLAQRIADWRDTHGGFTSTEQLGEVSGLGDKRLAELLPLVTV